MKYFCLLALFIFSLTPSAAAKLALADDEYITENLRAAAIAEVIDSQCNQISLRLFVIMFKAQELREYAHNLGHSYSEIDKFINNSSERARIYALRDQYFLENNVQNSLDYCKLGYKEIQNQSLIGSILSPN